MYAYKCGKYHQCLQPSQENVGRLWNETRPLSAGLSGPMTHLMDDDLSCFSAACILRLGDCYYPFITQLTLSIYFMIKSKLNLPHSATSLIRDLRLVRRLHSRHPAGNIRERLLLSFIYRRTIIAVSRRTRH